MKTPEDWASIMIGDIDENVFLARRIQADAIRWAANLSGDLATTAALAKADELDPPHE